VPFSDLDLNCFGKKKQVNPDWEQIRKIQIQKSCHRRILVLVLVRRTASGDEQAKQVESEPEIGIFSWQSRLELKQKILP